MTDIIFDLGGVLLDLDRQAMFQASRQLGIAPELLFVRTDAEDTPTICQGLSVGKLLADYQTGGMTTASFLALIREQCPEGTTDEQIVEAWNACIGDLPRHRLDPIQALRRKGYATHLLSNTNDLHWEEIKRRFFMAEGYRLTDLFDHVFVSHEVHEAKPGPEIYRQALREIGRPAGECLFIDDAEANVEGARRVGLQGAWLDVQKPEALQEILQPYLRG